MIISRLFGLLLGASCALSSSAYSVPADSQPFVYPTNSQGNLTLRKFGDEWFSWMKAEDGSVVIFNSTTKTFQFASVKTNGDGPKTLEPSGVDWKAGLEAPERITDGMLKDIWNSYIPNQSTGQSPAGK